MSLSKLAKISGVPCDVSPSHVDSAIAHAKNCTASELAARGTDPKDLAAVIAAAKKTTPAPSAPATPAAPVAADSEEEEITPADVRKMRKPELIALCEQEGLATDGTVADLKDRIFEHFDI